MKSGTRLEKAIEAMGERTGLEFSDLFSNFLDLSLTLLCNNPSDHQKKLMEATLANDKRKAAFCEAQKDTIKGWTNKMFIRPSLMPHHIRITDINVERLQDISKEDCLKEGIDEDHTEYGDALYWVSVPHKGISWEEYKKRSYELARHEFNGKTGSYFWDTPQGAFAALIDKVSGKGTWGRNPWVFAYSFELID